MSRLPDIQDAFQRYLLAGDSDIESHIVGTERFPIDIRLGIYGNGYRSRLIESLQSSFPVLAALLDEQFEPLAASYIGTHESTFFSIRYYGDQLADYLATHEEYSKAPILAEIARWEWAMADVFDAADGEPVDVSAFASLPPESWAHLRLQWSPSIRVQRVEWNTPELWKAVTEGHDPPEPELRESPAAFLLWRQSLQIFLRPLAPGEAAAVAAARAGQSFGELCVLLCEHLPEEEASLRAAGYLRGWVQSGLIAGITQG